MILLSGKVGYRRLYEPRQVNPGGALLFLSFYLLPLPSVVTAGCSPKAAWTGQGAIGGRNLAERLAFSQGFVY